MRPKNQLILKWQVPGAADELYDCITAAELAGVTTREFLKYCRFGLYQPLGDAERFGYCFDLEAIYLARQAEQARQQLQVNMRAAAVIVRLRQEVEELRQELGFWRRY